MFVRELVSMSVCVYACVCVCAPLSVCFKLRRWSGVFLEVCHYECSMHYITTISCGFQLPVIFSVVLIFSMIFSHPIYSDSPSHYIT